MGHGARHPARRHPGEDVRPDHAALPWHHRRRAQAEHGRVRVLQVGGAAAGVRPVVRDERDRQRHVAERRRRQRADQARPLRRPAHLQRHRSGRDLRRRLRGRDRPVAASRTGAHQRRRGPDRHAGRAGDQPCSRAVRLQAQLEGRQGSHLAADQGHRGRGRAGQAAAQRHRHLPGGHQRAHGGGAAGHAEVHAQRHLRLERDQGAVPRRRRRRRGRQRAVPRRAAQQARNQGRRQGVRGSARAQRPGGDVHDEQGRAEPDRRVGVQAVRHGAAEGRDVQELVRQASRRQGVGRRRERRQHRQAPAGVATS